MARLNEPPSSLESVESLKRRFIRQNRDLARSNSAQSIKIRHLETEISRLLAENIALGEEIVQLRTELENSANRNTVNRVLEIKGQLEAKLQEFNGLLGELGDLNKRHRRRKSQIPAPKESSESFRRRSVNLAELLAAQEGRLPTILEDKGYPRQTLDSQDIQVLLEESNTDSPDIGPPPKSSFDCNGTDNYTSNINMRQSYPPATYLEGSSDLIPDLIAGNFDVDTRRRRRSSSKQLDAIVWNAAGSPENHEPEEFEDLTARVSVKRKLSIHDDGELGASGIVQRDDRFCFSRKESVGVKDPKTVSNNKSLEDSLAKLVLRAPNDEAAQGISILGSPRKILGPKPINIDPMVASPKKACQNMKDMKKPEKTAPSKPSSKPRARSTRVGEHMVVPSQAAEDVVSAVDISLEVVKLEPKTPAAMHDMWSPTSSRPSEAPASSNDTPPPPGCGAADSQNIDMNATGRTSRRARSNVSYTEPSLVSKMRRPTRTLVDAVVVPKDGSRLSIKASEEIFTAVDTETSEPAPLRTVILTRSDSTKPTSRPVRKFEPPSPLRNKERPKPTDPNEEETTIKEEPDDTTPAQPGKPHSTPLVGFSRRLSESSKRRSMTPPTSSDTKDDSPGAAIDGKTSPSTTAPRPSTEHERRPSSVARASSSRRQTITTTTKATGAALTSSPATVTLAPDLKDGGGTGTRTKWTDKTASVASSLAGTATGVDVTKRRADRVAARRRSMML